MKAGLIFFRCDFRSPRLDYILNELLRRRLGLEFSVLSSQEAMPEGEICIHYGIPGGDLSYSDSGILQESSLSNWKLEIHHHAPVLKKGSMEFQGDLFGAVFWLLSRYEEQAAEITPDSHGRFPDDAHSLKSFLKEFPPVELWMEDLRKQLETKGIPCKRGEAKADFSLDWDNPTAYLQKGFLRQTGGFLSDLLKGNTAGMAKRFSVLTGKKPDPYDNLGTIIHSDLLAGKRIFFWLGDYGKYDKGLSWKNDWYRKEIRKLSANMIPGLHPSYACLESPDKIAAEKKRLEEILGREIRASRFHFLRFRLPESYRMLEEAGISEDYSMGFSAFPGYRAGTALPFAWFDLEKNLAGNLLIHPFSLMDSSRAFSGKMKSAFLAEAMRQLNNGREYGFPVHGIFHNEHPSWPGWEDAIADYGRMNVRSPG